MADLMRGKYTRQQRDAMAGKEAMADGSYPIADEADLKRAIRAAGRAADRTDLRAHVIQRAATLDLAAFVPDGWAQDGALKDSAWSHEQRETANDMWAAIQGALDDVLDGQFECWSIWVQDWMGSGDDAAPYRAIYCAGGDLYAVNFTFEDDKVVIDGASTVKVRPVTDYIPRNAASPLLEWRKRKVADLKGLERRTFPASDMELREADDGLLHLSGYASVTDTPYEVGFYKETIQRGAFKRTLGEQPDVQLLINHEGMPLARTKSGTLRLAEDDRGLRVEADLDPEDPDVQSLARKMKRGDIDQMSFAFQATDQDWNTDFTARTIKVVSIHRGDVSVVNQAANPAAMASIRSQDAIRALARIGGEGLVTALSEWRDHTLLPLEARGTQGLSAPTMEALSNVLNLIAAADDSADEAQPLLATLMSVPTPDTTDEGAPDKEPPVRAVTIPDYTTRARQALAVLEAKR